MLQKYMDTYNLSSFNFVKLVSIPIIYHQTNFNQSVSSLICSKSASLWRRIEFCVCKTKQRAKNNTAMYKKTEESLPGKARGNNETKELEAERFNKKADEKE